MTSPAPIHRSTPANTAGCVLQEEPEYQEGRAMFLAGAEPPPWPWYTDWISWEQDHDEVVEWRLVVQGWHDAARGAK